MMCSIHSLGCQCQPPPFTNLLYLQMQSETTDCCCQSFFEVQSHDSATWYNGKRYCAGVC